MSVDRKSILTCSGEDRSGTIRDAISVLESGISAVLPETVLKRGLEWSSRTDSLTIGDHLLELDHGRLFVIGAGKSAGAMALAFERIVGPDRVMWGWVNSIRQTDPNPVSITIHPAGHPLPDEDSLAGTRAMLDTLLGFHLVRTDHVIVLLSGGASAMLCQPQEPVTLQDKIELTGRLIRSGGDIASINCVRKHLSMVKGGKLGRLLSPATVVTMCISDVEGDRPEVIGSGPTVSDESTPEDAIAVLWHHNIWTDAPDSVRRLLMSTESIRRAAPDYLDRCRHHILAGTGDACEAMREKAGTLGYRAWVDGDYLRGDPDQASQRIAGAIRQMARRGGDALIWGGEVTPHVVDCGGTGGRLQHLMLTLLSRTDGLGESWVIAGAASDGCDYTKGVAGAWIETNPGERHGEDPIILDHLARFDSGSYFRNIRAGLILSGETGTNVADLIVCLRKRQGGSRHDT